MEKNNTINKENNLEIAFVFLCFFIYFTWSLMQPYNSCPDEYMRYDIPKFIFQYGKLPLGEDPSIRNPIWGISYGFRPVLPALISSILMKCVNLFSTNDFALLMGARMGSILASIGTVIFTIKISKKLFKKSIAWIFIIFVSLLPQFIFISTYVNCDALAVFSTSIIIYYWIVGYDTHWNMRSCVGLAIGLSICALSYSNAYGFILISIIFFFWSSINFKDEPNKIKNMIKRAIFISIIVFLLAGWWFIRNFMLYKDFFGHNTELKYSELYANDEYKPSNRKTPYNLGYTFLYMLFRMGWLKESYYSFVGKFGYMSIPLDDWMYWIYNGLFLVALVGFLFRKKQREKENKYIMDSRMIIFYICMFLSAIIPILLSIYYSFSEGFQPQGRYCLPMLIPFAFFIVKGIDKVYDHLPHFKENFLFIIVLSSLVVAFACLFQLIPKSYF